MFSLVVLDRILHDLSKFRLFTVKTCILICFLGNFLLSQRGNDFIASSANEDTISSLAVEQRTGNRGAKDTNIGVEPQKRKHGKVNRQGTEDGGQGGEQ